MTDTTPETETVEVTQADRDAAKALLDQLHLRQHETGSFRSWDETVEAFARHRTRATRQDGLREACPSMLVWAAHNPGDLQEDRANIICEGADVILAANIDRQSAESIAWAHNQAIATLSDSSTREESGADASPLANETGALRAKVAAFERAASLFFQWETTIMVQFDGTMDREQYQSLGHSFERLKAAAALSASPEGEG